MSHLHSLHACNVSWLACVIIAASAFTLTSCGTTIDPTPSVDLRSAVGRLDTARTGNVNARAAVANAKQTLRATKATNAATAALAKQMEREASRHAGSLEKLTQDYGAHITQLQQALIETDGILQTQEEALQVAQQELAYAHDASKLSEEEKVALRKERDRWKTKYLKLTKYRWAVYSLLVVVALSVIAKIKGFLF